MVQFGIFASLIIQPAALILRKKFRTDNPKNITLLTQFRIYTTIDISYDTKPFYIGSKPNSTEQFKHGRHCSVYTKGVFLSHCSID